MKRIFITAACACFLTVALAALTPDEQKQYQALLKTVDGMVTFMDTDFSAEYTIVKDTPGEGQSVNVAAMFRRDKENKYLIVMLKPDVDKGKGYLKIDNNLWLWDPVARRFNVTSAKDRFQNSNARNSDFTRSNLANDYKVVQARWESLGKFDCVVLDLEATNSGVTFPVMRVWISQDNLVRKTEDYSLSKQLMRTTAIPSYQKIDTRYVPVSMVIVDELRGKKINGTFVKERTQVTIAKPSLEKQSDLLFTKTYLEKVR
jgi:hypothetical protein